MFSHLPQNLTLANYRQQLESQFIYIGVYEDLQTSIDQLATVLDKPTMQLPVSNASEYDENVPNHLREQFYRDYPLPKKIYDFALENYLTPSQTQEAEVQRADVQDDSTSQMSVNEGSFPLGDDEVVCGDMVMTEESA